MSTPSNSSSSSNNMSNSFMSNSASEFSSLNILAQNQLEQDFHTQFKDKPDIMSPNLSAIRANFDSNLKMNLEAQQNLLRLQQFQDSCSSVSTKNKLRGVIEQTYKAQIQNLLEELAEAKADKSILETKLQLSLKQHVDYISESRSGSQSVPLAQKLKDSEKQSKELAYQVQELTTELKLAKVAQNQSKKIIESLQKNQPADSQQQTATPSTKQSNANISPAPSRNSNNNRLISLQAQIITEKATIDQLDSENAKLAQLLFQ